MMTMTTTHTPHKITRMDYLMLPGPATRLPRLGLVLSFLLLFFFCCRTNAMEFIVLSGADWDGLMVLRALRSEVIG
jgi:hypothetical protein